MALKKGPAPKRRISKKRRGLKIPVGRLRNERPADRVGLADGALIRLFGKGNEEAASGGWVSKEELILADSKLRPDLYPELVKPKKRRVNPSGKSGY